MIDDWPSILNAGFRTVRIDVYETPEEVVVSCELPGLEKKDDVQIDVEGTQLTISGQIRRGQEIKREQF
ncbi:MAG TPA: Hsp20/alpha crystallin family protein, partial [Clostridia bacterium]|nr:Hsp20/alpha crystallin family protein [Clostridia bacterium]